MTNTQVKMAVLVILSIGMVTALTIATLTAAENSAFAKKKHCEKSHKSCDDAKVDSKQSAQNTTSKNVTQAGLDRSLAQMDNSTTFGSQLMSPF
jgi:hypothetical protein